MRRSAAPSQKSALCLKNNSSVNENIANSQALKTKPQICIEQQRQTIHILNLLHLNSNTSDNIQDETESLIKYKNDQANKNRNVKLEKQYHSELCYDICWAKKSTKKHKIWEGDGVMIVQNDFITIKDEEGNVIGQQRIKNAQFEYGQIINVNGKDVQVLNVRTEKIINETKENNFHNIYKKQNNNIKFEKKIEISHTVKSKTEEEPNITTTTTNSSEVEIIKEKHFTTCWAKKSTKKHKTWDGDGTLTIKNNIAIFKDDIGNIIGKLTKNLNFSEGQIISLGGKEIQIVEEIETNKILNSPPQKRLKLSNKSNSSFNPIYNLTSNVKSNKANIMYKRIVLPHPSSEHQWEYNDQKLPVSDVAIDPILGNVLRQHQIDGIVFLYKCLLGHWNVNYSGAILADEMGLGKTLQCITLIWTLLKNGPYGGKPLLKRVLIVTPSSLTANWQKEFVKWLGKDKLKIFMADSKNKPNDYVINCQNMPVMIISYDMLIRHSNDIKQVEFDLMICDEGHRLKNENTKATQILNELEVKKRILLSGTPIQNDLLEYFSLINFVNPNSLGKYEHFKCYYEQPIIASRLAKADEESKNLGKDRASELNKITSNFILRRTKDVIQKFLTAKIECVVFVELTQVQKNIYNKYLDAWWDEREKSPLSMIVSLKKICNHPSLVSAEEKQKTSSWSYFDSNKFVLILEILKNARNSEEKIVLCSSYTKTLDLLETLCIQNGFGFLRLDGSTASVKRMEIVNQFNGNDKEKFVFLLSAKAGGVGLNLIGASRFVLTDSDWNPATDLQAMDRIWRDGQKKSVTIYRLLTAGTIEEKIYQRQITKMGLSNTVSMEVEDSLRLSEEDLKDLFSSREEMCSTHIALNCNCQGNGTIISDISSCLNENDEDRKKQERSCQLGVTTRKDSNKNKSNTMGQLMQWNHYSRNFIDENLTLMLGFNSDTKSIITFLFVNKCYN